ncbi:MAG: enoyl-CoA hydratase/isomerase family protein [bacterium]|nr:enoyl-CoA hydratase/isomerase family protein [bacterium]
MEYEQLIVDVKDDIGRITFNRPKQMNAYNEKMSLEFAAAIKAFSTDPAVRVVVITGNGKAFMAGADIGMLKGWLDAPDPPAVVEETLARFFSPNLLEQCPKPVIAGINGLAFGMGCEVAMGCDIRIAAESAKFAQPEVSIAVITGAGGSQRLPRLVGYGKAVQMLLTGDPIDAAEALQCGLVTQVVPDDQLEDAIAVMVKKLLKKSDTALRLSKEALMLANTNGLYDGIAQELKLFAGIFESPDAKEGIAAFLEKRKPAFNKGK